MKNIERPEVKKALVDWIIDDGYGQSDFEKETGFSVEYQNDEQLKFDLLNWLDSEYSYKIFQAEKGTLELFLQCGFIEISKIHGVLNANKKSGENFVLEGMEEAFDFMEPNVNYIIIDILKDYELRGSR